MISDNPDLGGKMTPKCGLDLYVLSYVKYSYALDTNITICGCAAAGTPPSVFPPPNTPIACLATGIASPLVKRVQVFSNSLKNYQLTCNVDDNKNPFQDCLNAMSAFCDSSHIKGNSTRIKFCKTLIDQMVSYMSPLWRAVRDSCAPWKGRDPASSGCSKANSNLIAGAYYATPKGNAPVSPSLTDSIKKNLWSNPGII